MEDSSVDVAFRGTASHPQTTRRTTETGIDEPEAAGLTGLASQYPIKRKTLVLLERAND